MAFKVVDLMVDLLPQGDEKFAAGGGEAGCTSASCRAAATKEGARRPRPRPAVELAALRTQLQRAMGAEAQL